MKALIRQILARSPLARAHTYRQPAAGFAGWVTVLGVPVAFSPADGGPLVTSW